MILREEKEWENKYLLPGQGDNVTVGGGVGNISVVKAPSSVSKVKMSLKHIL